ncbi:hypothetical protein ACFV23_27330, partial [Streptomyces sp. NPDC059627]
RDTLHPAPPSPPLPPPEWLRPAPAHPPAPARRRVAPRRGTPAPGRALGTLLAQIANFVMPQKILLAGEGVGLMEVAGETVRDAVRAHRHPLAAPIGLETKVSDFHDWARGAAVLAIQVLVLGRAGG